MTEPQRVDLPQPRTRNGGSASRPNVDAEGEPVNGQSAAVASCQWCGGRALSRAGHPLAGNGIPVCWTGKRGWQW